MGASQAKVDANAAAAKEVQLDGPFLDKDTATKRTGSISIGGRYSNARKLEEDYTLQPKIVGSGMSGPVHLAVGNVDGRKYAVKSFKKKGLSARRRAELKSEVQIYIALDHPHVARLENVYETDEELHLVMEFMAGGELYERLSAKKRYTEEAAADASRQMLRAVAYLHANKVAHRDLKLENFLYEKPDTDHLKLIDFGFAKFWDRSTHMTQACGSLHYVAPEVLKHCYTEKADVWSAGVIIFMLLSGAPPFSGTDREVLKKIQSGDIHWSSRFKRASPMAQDFVRKILVYDPEKRLSANDALAHPWIASSTSEDRSIDIDVLDSFRAYAHASHFKRAILSMMAWSLSGEERAALREEFLLMDTNKTGTITHCQLKDLLQETFHIDSHEADMLFQSLDVNNDNEIGYSEFLAAAMQGRVKAHEDVLRRTFQRFDSTQSGQITKENLRQILGETFEDEDIEELIREADTTGDGMISYDEFLDYFHRSDADDGNGVGANNAPPVTSKKRRHRTEKLGKVLDKLILEECTVSTPTSQNEPETSSTPTSRFLRRRTVRAQTLPARVMTAKSGA